MRSPKEIEKIVDHLDADPLTTEEHGKFGNLWFMSRMKKISGTIDGMLGQVSQEMLG